MEVSGRKESDDSITLCQPCEGDGDTVQAEGYCENCNKFICSSCIKAHKKLNHVIKSKDVMSNLQSARGAPCTELCDNHMNEIVKFYCKEHDSVGCGKCMELKHTLCKVHLVSDVSGNYGDSDELVLIKHRIDKIQKNLDSCKREIKLSLKSADEIKTNVIKEIEQFREEMDTYLDKVTKNLIQEVEKLNARDVLRQQKLLGQCKTTTEDIENLRSKLDQCKDTVNDLFVSSKLTQVKLKTCQEVNEEISAGSLIYSLTFTPTQNVNSLKEQDTRLGNLHTQIKKYSGDCDKSIIDMKACFIQKINMKEKQKRDYGIGGMTTISEDEILCTDCPNMSLKVLNHKKRRITSILKTPCPAADVTTINSSSAAATLYKEGKILFLDTTNGLTVSHSIKVRAGCNGIDHHEGIMAVTFLEPPAVHVIDMEGHILHEVNDTSLLEVPECVCLSNDNKSMFVSDTEKGRVYEFSLNGHLKNAIISEEMKSPVGITVTNCGAVVVSYLDKSNMVGVIVPGAREIIPFYVSNIQKPWSILICEEQKQMFITENYESREAGIIKMFDLK